MTIAGDVVALVLRGLLVDAVDGVGEAGLDELEGLPGVEAEVFDDLVEALEGAGFVGGGHRGFVNISDGRGMRSGGN